MMLFMFICLMQGLQTCFLSVRNVLVDSVTQLFLKFFNVRVQSVSALILI